MKHLRLIFMGTPGFAVASLSALLEAGFNVVAVVTAADKPAGRGQQLGESAVKKFAVQKGLNLLQPLKLKDPEFVNQLALLKADLQIVVAFRMLPEEVWNMPKYGTYNLHASLLPKYRGAAPINWAIINGETETGVTTFKLKHEIDTGNILFSEKVAIDANTTAGELHDSLMMKGANLLVKTVKEIETCVAENREPDFIEQNNAGVCHAPKLFRDTCRINWTKSITEIHNLIRGLSPYPGAFTELENSDGRKMTLKLFASLPEKTNHNYTNGYVLTDGKTFLKVACSDGLLSILDVQLEGKRRMKTEDLLRGFKLDINTRLT